MSHLLCENNPLSFTTTFVCSSCLDSNTCSFLFAFSIASIDSSKLLIDWMDFMSIILRADKLIFSLLLIKYRTLHFTVLPFVVV